MLFTQPNETTLRADQEMLNKLWQMATTQLPGEPLIHRSLRPEDVGYANPAFFSTLSSTAWQNLVNTYSIADNRFIGISGVNYNTTSVTALKFTRAGKTARIWSIQQLMDSEDKIAYADDPITAEQNTELTIQGYAAATSDAAKVVLLGRVVEPRGLLINP